MSNWTIVRALAGYWATRAWYAGVNVGYRLAVCPWRGHEMKMDARGCIRCGRPLVKH